MAQRQDSLIDQLATVRDLANEAGCYDAADWIERSALTVTIPAQTPPSAALNAHLAELANRIRNA